MTEYITHADEYQEFTRETAIYPGAKEYTNDAITYCVLGLLGEAGEVAEKLKKTLRSGGEAKDLVADVAMAKELGDVCWYLARLSDELAISFSEVLNENVKKLSSRKDRGVLQGSGDNR